MNKFNLTIFLQEISVGPPRFELESLAPKAVFKRRKMAIKIEQLDEFMAFREIEGLCDEWVELTRQFIHHYLDFVNWSIDKKNTLEYLNIIRKKHSTTYYRKKAYQIRKFLTYLDVDWAKDIKPPSEPTYLPKRITLDSIKDSYFAPFFYNLFLFSTNSPFSLIYVNIKAR